MMCHKCWKDSGGDTVRYELLVEERKLNPCTEAQQRGAVGHILISECHDFDGEDFIELAIECIDQAGYSINVQSNIKKMLTV